MSERVSERVSESESVRERERERERLLNVSWEKLEERKGMLCMCQLQARKKNLQRNE